MFKAACRAAFLMVTGILPAACFDDHRWRNGHAVFGLDKKQVHAGFLPDVDFIMHQLCKDGNDMKKSYVLLIVLCALAACNRTEGNHTANVTKIFSASSSSVTDDKMPKLARDNNCTACHAIDKRVVGPAWIDVSRKYKGDPGAEARLIVKVSNGGAGVWGAMPMPANDASGEKQGQIRELVRFILGLAK
jgi:cytochrome c